VSADCRDDHPSESAAPLTGAELIGVLRCRWQASYDLQVVRRRGRPYLQVMWAHLEQQSFPLSPEAYGARLEEVAALLTALGAAAQVRRWLLTTAGRPRLGRALVLPLEVCGERAGEFLL
jgi:ribosomal protein S12 methylthiotransferase accessory factor YcaO